MAKKPAKFITIMGSTGGIGTTTIANYVATEIAKAGNVTLLIEFSKKTGFSVYMQKGILESRRSLSEVMLVPEKLHDNTIKSRHTSNLRYLCMNFVDDCMKMRNYQPTNISEVISIAKKYYEYIILDLPADTFEPIFPTIYSGEFLHKPDHQIIVVNEQANSFKYLNDLNAVMMLANESVPRDTTFVLNGVEGAHYQDYIIDYLPSLPITKPVNLVYLPQVEGLSVICNKGEIYQMGITPTTKLYLKHIEDLANIIIKDLKNIKLDTRDEKKQNSSLIGSIFGVFGQQGKDSNKREKSNKGKSSKNKEDKNNNKSHGKSMKKQKPVKSRKNHKSLKDEEDLEIELED